MPRFFYTILLLSLVILRHAPAIAAEDSEQFRTRYAAVYYADEKDLDLFLWRISQTEIDIRAYPGLAKSRLDRIIEKVQAILDMYPHKFHIDIYLHPEYRKGRIASYSERKKSITVYADRVTQGVLAHEIAHAVISSYFRVPPPPKVREILSQYVDRHFY